MISDYSGRTISSRPMVIDKDWGHMLCVICGEPFRKNNHNTMTCRETCRKALAACRARDRKKKAKG
jgi:predicted nucleic acid-binding Zn ribbon protein